ncbi:MAG TPA: GNAT family N-acetyltransferase [Chloroflexota bacterium]|nr:GNAT family N-acetyltransferase [Chloroflexota bacterium]
MEITFRLAKLADMDVIVSFHVALNEYDGTVADPARARAGLQLLMGRDDFGGVWLICADGDPVGYIVLTWGFSLEFGGRDAFVDELYIEEDYRGQGVGRQTLAFAESICQARNHLEVERENANAQVVYEKVGFEKRAGYFLMSKRLGGA